MKVLGLVLVGCCCLPGRGESACFRTAKEAAAQSGVRDGEGFRLEGVRMDRVGGSRWARVVSCGHPEWPGLAVKLVGGGGELGESTPPFPMKPERMGHPGGRVAVVAAGAAVRVVRMEAMARLEMAGVAQESGGVGDAVKVRVGLLGEERFASGVVRGEGLVELEAGR